VKVAILTTDSREHFKQYEKPEPFFGTAPEALLQGFAGIPGVEVHVISCLRHPVPTPFRIADNIWYHALVVPKSGWMSTFYQGCIRAVRSKLREIKPEIVHGQGSERDCAISAVFSGYPNVVTIHGNMAELARMFQARIGSFGWLAARLENFSLKRTAGVFCNSVYTQQLVAPRAQRAWLVPNAIRAEFFAPPASPATQPARPVLINVGLVCPRKRQLELLDLAERLHQAGNTFALHFIGDASPANAYGAAFFEKIKPMEKAGYARYVGKMNTPELIRYFDQSQAMVHFPSEEAFGLVVAEALARDLKFFGAQLGGITDIAKDVPGAELFTGEDWQGLQAGIARWLRLGAPRNPATQPIISSRYHPRQIAQRHLEIYREVLSTRS
jgi:glycosyltransferase involved in cell wall biosynthesis